MLTTIKALFPIAFSFIIIATLLNFSCCKDSRRQEEIPTSSPQNAEPPATKASQEAFSRLVRYVSARPNIEDLVKSVRDLDEIKSCCEGVDSDELALYAIGKLEHADANHRYAALFALRVHTWSSAYHFGCQPNHTPIVQLEKKPILYALCSDRDARLRLLACILVLTIYPREYPEAIIRQLCTEDSALVRRAVYRTVVGFERPNKVTFEVAAHIAVQEMDTELGRESLAFLQRAYANGDGPEREHIKQSICESGRRLSLDSRASEIWRLVQQGVTSKQ